MCQPLSRRQFLRYAGLAAATPLVAQAFRAGPVKAFRNVGARAVPMHLELVTVTDTSAVLTWLTADPLTLDTYNRPQPVPADTIVEWGTDPLRLDQRYEAHHDTPFHYVELRHLEPGTTYYYRCISNGLAAVPTQFAPEPVATGVFTTLVPPGGDLLFTMAWANDVHLGEMTSGLAYSTNGIDVPPGYAADPRNPYSHFMARAAAAEAKDRGAELLLLNGDLTSEAEPENLMLAKQIFDEGFGPYQSAYFVARGNHDRAHRDPSCSPVDGHPGYTDCLADVFFRDGKTQFSFDHGGTHFIGMDTVDITSGNGSLPQDRLEEIVEDLRAHDGTPTFLFGHHPVSEEGRATTIGGPGFSLSDADAQALERAIAGTSVVGVYSGHTHRNKRSHSVVAPDIPFIELGAVKEYPGGYGLVKVYERGYMVNFYKTKGDEARAWSEQSRGEYLGLYPYYTLGTFADRNFTVAYPS